MPSGMLHTQRMTRFRRIFAAIVVLSALVPATSARGNVICVESSGRISYGCDDIVPDELRVSGVPLSFGFSSQDCGFCHDYIVGQAVIQSFHVSAIPILINEHLDVVLCHPLSPAKYEAKPVPILDSSGSIPPLKC